MATCDAEALLASGSEFEGLGNLDLLRLQVALTRSLAAPATSVQDLVNDGQQFAGLSNRDILITQAQLLCELI